MWLTNKEKEAKKKFDTTLKRNRKERKEILDMREEKQTKYDERIERQRTEKRNYNQEAVQLMREHWKETAQFLQSKKDKEREIYNRLLEYYDANSGAKADELRRKAAAFVAELE
jgi:hypothetical protein